MVMVMKIRSDHGASAVEFALVLPVLMLLTFGIIEFGILLFDKAVITNASREGARMGIVFATDEDGGYAHKTDAEIRQAVKDYANGILINLGPGGKKNLADGDIEVDPPEVRVPGGDLTVTVNFSYDFLVLPDLSSLVGGTFNSTLPLKGETVMRME
jgi:hypothetical protein